MLYVNYYNDIAFFTYHSAEQSTSSKYLLRVVSLSKDAFTPRKVLVISRKRWHRADMKDIVEWDVKHLNTKKQAFGAFKGWLKTI